MGILHLFQIRVSHAISGNQYVGNFKRFAATNTMS